MNDRKTILITGGTGGIGAEVARICKVNGWNVCITGNKKSTMLGSLTSELELEYSSEWLASDKKGIEKIVSSIIERFGRIDALVNAVGIVNSKPFLEIDKKDAVEVYETNVLGTIYAIQAVVPHMLKNETQSSIVNISSVRGYPNLASARSITYSMSKAAIQSLTASLAKVYSPKIKINAIAPGFILTSMSSDWSESTWHNAKNQNYYKRPGDPAEIARHIYFLISEQSSFMVGQTLLVDGGYELYEK